MTTQGRTLLHVDGALATITFDNPAARNALTAQMYEDLAGACGVVAADPAVRLVVIRGEGSAFAAGTDIRDLLAITDGQQGVAYERDIVRVLDAVRALRVPVVALVQGPAVGGGLAIVACCDFVYCTPDAVFGAPVARTLGNCVSPTTIARIRAVLGRRLANEMLLTGRLVTADEAHAAGLVAGIVAPDELDGMASDLLGRVSRCAPLSVAAAKEFGQRLDDLASAVETADVYTAVYGSEDFREGVRSFLAKRRPRWLRR